MKTKYIDTLVKSSMALLLILAVSCEKLDENPKGLSTSKNFYTTPTQCEAAFASSMNTLYNAWSAYNAFLGGLPDGQFEGASLAFGPDAFADYWRVHYAAIKDINAALMAVKGGSLTPNSEEVINNIIGQGKFLRAFNYFTLVRLYGKIPYITEDTPNPVVNSLTPASRLEIATIYDNLQSDLLFAIDNLDDYDPATPARPNKWMAKALLTKVYLTRATAPLNQVAYYAQARDMADDIIKNGPYQLLSDFREVFKSSNNNNLEMIISFQVTPDDPNIDGIALAPSEWGGWSGGPVKITWAEAYPEQPRKHNYLLMDFPEDITDPTNNIINYSASIDGVPYIGKYNFPTLTIDEALGVSQQNQPIMRFADVLLMYAEAANMANNGPTQLAVDRLNLIIDRANTPVGAELAGTEPRATIGMTKAAFDAKVIQERNLELCFEFDWYFDVLRKGMLEQVNLPDNAVDYDINDYLLPIPTLDATFIGNNPGY